MNKLIKLDRIAAWILFVCLVLYFISGYGMTKGVLDANFAKLIHIDILSYIIMISFVIHTGFATYLALKRLNFWNTIGKTIWILFYLIFIIFIVYVESFYLENNAIKKADQTPIAPTTVANTATGDISNTQTTAIEKIFTATELAKYDGKNGNPAYVAVDGVVYDMSTVFKNGTHYTHVAGQDLSDAFYVKHIKSQITKYPVVGKME